MLVLQNLITAVEQIWANKLRSVLTVLGVIIAVTSTIVVVAVVQGFSGYVTNFLKGLGTNAIWVLPERPPEYDTSPMRAEMVRADVEEVEQSCSAISRLSPLSSAAA
jgi:putative ABC transport system permease protein